MNNKGVFITGTDTDVGKTLVSAIFMAGLDNAAYWKPVQSGTDQGIDSRWIMKKTGLSHSRFLPETWLLKEYLSPHAAAIKQGVNICLDDFHLPRHNGPLIVEGAGGVMVPLNKKDLILDLMKKLALPVILVTRSALGTINHTLMSLDVLRRHDIIIAGVVMNGPVNASNKEAIEHYGETRVILEVEPLKEITKAELSRLYWKMDTQWN